MFRLRLALFLVRLKIALLRAIEDARHTYVPDEPDGSWTTCDAHELATWDFRFLQPKSPTLIEEV